MKNIKSKITCPIKDVTILFLLTLVKTILLYTFTVQDNIFKLVFTTIPPLIVVYGLVNLIKSKRRYIHMLIVHIIVSSILFADLVYYNHYNFLPSARALTLLGLVPAVSDSVFYILKPIHFIMLLDIVPLIVYFSKQKGEKMMFTKKGRFLNKSVVAIMLLLFIFTTVYVSGNSIHAYSNYGVYSYHVKDIYEIFANEEEKAFDKMNIKEVIVDTVKEKKPIENRKYFGIGKNKNIITIQFESLQNFVINKSYYGQEITPNLNKLIKENSIYFNNFYQQVGPGNTSDADFVSHNSIYPTTKYATTKEFIDNNFYTMYNVLKENGYSNKVFHGYKADFWNRSNIYPSYGVEDYISLEDFTLDEKIGLGLSDESFYKQSIEILKEMDNPFYAFMISLTSHNPYEIPENKRELDLLDKHKDTLFGNYLQSIKYSDKALGEFIDDLKDQGLYDKSIIVIYGDHQGLLPRKHSDEKGNYEIMTDFLGREYNYRESMNVPFIINIPDLGKSETNPIAGSEIDYMPTILNLLGIDDYKSIYFGQDLNNTKEGFVAFQYYLPKGSFIDDEKVFIMSKDGIYENSKAWDLKTNKPIDIEECREGYKKAIKRITQSHFILERDLVDEIINIKN